jgi:hypothetical protein
MMLTLQEFLSSKKKIRLKMSFKYLFYQIIICTLKIRINVVSNGLALLLRIKYVRGWKSHFVYSETIEMIKPLTFLLILIVFIKI